MGKVGVIGKKSIPQKKLKLYDEEEMEFLVAIVDGAASVGGTYNESESRYESLSAYVYFIGIESLADGVIREGRGHLTWEITEEEIQSGEYAEYFDDNAIYRVRGRRSRDWVKNTNHFGNYIYVTEILEKNVSSEAMAGVLEKYYMEVAIVSEVLGKLILNKEFEMYEGFGNWGGQKVRAALEVIDESQVDEGLKLLEQFFANAQEWDDKMRKEAAEDFMMLINDWEDDQEEVDGISEITKEDFAGRIRIESVSMCTDGDFTVYFDNDEMFLGYVVCVCIYGNVEKGIINVETNIGK